MKATDHTDETYTARPPEPALDATAHTEGSVTMSRVTVDPDLLGATSSQVTLRSGVSDVTGFPTRRRNRRGTSVESHRKRKARQKMQKASRRKNRNK